MHLKQHQEPRKMPFFHLDPDRIVNNLETLTDLFCYPTLTCFHTKEQRKILLTFIYFNGQTVEDID